MARVFKRTAIFAPLILIVVFWTGGDSTTSSKIFTAVTLVAFFIPFSYLVDSIMYRVYSKRQRGAAPGSWTATTSPRSPTRASRS